MDNVQSFKFEYSDLTTILLKQKKITEGFWNIGFEMSVGIGVMGPTPEEAVPGVNVLIQSITLTKLRDGEPVTPYTVDASKVT